MNSKNRKTGLACLSGMLAGLVSLTATAAPGTVSQSPLFLTNAAEPNIMLLVDDSGSMDWEDLLNQGTSSPGNAILSASTAYNPPGPYTDWWDHTLRRLFCSGFNVMAYNPNINYIPWTGHDNSNSPYPNMSITAARTDPNDPSSTVDISNHYYWVWNDADGDGEYDGPGSTDSGAAASPSDECGDVSSNSGGVAVSSLSAADQTNYANWYTYYRKREYVAKSAFGSVIANANSVRMGLATLHNNNSVNTAIASMNQNFSSGNKRALLDELYSINSSGGTPLRRTLEDAGQYLSCQTNGFGFGCPALPSGSGGECQQNFSLLMTDGFWNGGDPSVGNADGDNDSSFDGASYADSYDNTLADVAMHYYETDIRPTVSDDVPTKTGVDENPAQHMVTYTIAFGVNGTLTAMPSDPSAAFAWPDPISNGGAERIDDLRHAAWNGRGQFLSAGDPDSLRQSLDAAIASISSRTGSAASVAFNSGSLSTNTQVYLALFNSENWSGDIRAFDLDPNTGKIDSPSWGTDPNTGDPIGAADILDAANVSTRTILTYDGADGIPLQWSDLTAGQKADFRTNPSGGTDNEATGMARLGHLRGDRGCESGSTATCLYNDGSNTYNTRGLRARGSRLGDIVHSSPVFVGEPELNWPDTAPFPDSSGSTYSDFKLNKANRTGVLYVGGNDGLLHAFRASDGAEIMAYAPNALFSTNTTEGYHYLADPAYSHRYYVDLTPAIADVNIKTTSSGNVGWHTVLVGGLRAGGRGLFALDITDPNTFSEASGAPANTVMWEFTNADDPNLGLTFSKPSIVPLEGPSGSIRWAAIFGNGYNADGDPGSTGTAQLFIVFLEGGLDGTWSVGSDYITIDTEAGSIVNQDCSDPGSDCNGLATPAVIDSNGDGLADRAYAGDLKGNLWAFDLSGSNAGQWSVAYKSGSSPVALFQTQTNQPITVSPTIIRNPDMGTVSSNHPNTLVLFGTGQYLTTGDITNTDDQSFYAIWDAGSDLPNSNQLPLDHNSLIEQTIGTGTSSSGVTGRTLSDNTVDYSSNPPDYGWYMDLPEAGERVTTDPVIRGDLVFFNTITPDTDICASGGTSWLMIVKTSNGGRPDKVAFDLNGDGKLDALDEIGGDAAAGKQVQGLATSPVNLGDKRYVATTETDDGDKIETDDIEKISNDNTGRLSWEEVTIE